MMRRWSLIVKRFPRLCVGRRYPLRVVNVRPSRDPSGLLVCLENLDPAQQGRIHECLLPLPIHPDGPGAAFFRSCGIEAAVGSKITPRDAIGGVLAVRFRHSADGKDFVIASFEPAQEQEEVPAQQARMVSTESGKPPASQKPASTTEE